MWPGGEHSASAGPVSSRRGTVRLRAVCDLEMCIAWSLVLEHMGPGTGWNRTGGETEARLGKDRANGKKGHSGGVSSRVWKRLRACEQSLWEIEKEVLGMLSSVFWLAWG